MSEQDVLIGRVVKSHGVRGEVVVDPTTDVPAERFAAGTVLRSKQGRVEHEYEIESSRFHKNRVLVKLVGVDDRTTADRLRGTRFYGAPRVDDDGFYDYELEGLRVVHEGQDIGVVVAVVEGVAHNLLECAINQADESRSDEFQDSECRSVADQDAASQSAASSDSESASSRTVLIPFVEAIVPSVDIDSGTIIITPPEGLLDL